MANVVRYQFAYATGHNVAYGSLTNFETVTQIARPPRAAPVNAFPVRTRTLDQQERGDGSIEHIWLWDVLSYTAFMYWQDAIFLSGGAYLSTRACTVNTMYTINTYGRYNAYLHLPTPPSTHDGSDGDYRIQGGKIVEFRQRMTILAKL